MHFKLVGGAGYIGQRLHAHLLMGGHDVTVVDPIDTPLRQARNSGGNTAVFFAWPRKRCQDQMDSNVNRKSMEQLRSQLLDTIDTHKFTLFVSSAQAGQGRYGEEKLKMEEFVRGLDTDRAGVVRLGTVAGASLRMRPELCVNSMLISALTTGEVIVKGAELGRCHAGIDRVCDEIEYALLNHEVRSPLVCDCWCTMETMGRAVAQLTGSKLKILPGEAGVTSTPPNDSEMTPSLFVELIYDDLAPMVGAPDAAES